MSKVVSWFSCGAASAVATKLALIEHPDLRIVRCEVREEHSDNERFARECQEWFGKEIETLGNDDYDRSIYEVFRKTRYLVGPAGARCTGELKKKIRERMQEPGDVHVMGYTADEARRAEQFRERNPDVDIWPILIERGLTKQDCLGMIDRAGIDLPTMYHLGYNNNNCVGCVKASSPSYWKKIEQDFPDMFKRMAETEEELGRTVCKIEMDTVKSRYPDIYRQLGEPPTRNEKDGKTSWRPKLTELPDDIPAFDDSLDVQCGIFCDMASQDIENLIVSGGDS